MEIRTQEDTCANFPEKTDLPEKAIPHIRNSLAFFLWYKVS
jgi:hypothetical protein